MEKLLDEVSFDAPDLHDKDLTHRRRLRRPHARRNRRATKICRDISCSRLRDFRTAHVGLRRSARRRARGAGRCCAACGKKGPPLAPLNMAPEAPCGGDGAPARRHASTSSSRCRRKSASGRGPFSIDHLDVYAVTHRAGHADAAQPRSAQAGARRSRRFRCSRRPIPTRAEPDTPDTRPLPGDTMTFVETLTPAQLAPQVITQAGASRRKRQRRRDAGRRAGRAPRRPRSRAGARRHAPPPPVGASRAHRALLRRRRACPTNGKPALPSARMPVPLLAGARAAPRPGATAPTLRTKRR